MRITKKASELLTGPEWIEATALLRLEPEAAEAMEEAVGIARGNAELLELMDRCLERIAQSGAADYRACVRDLEQTLEDHEPLLQASFGKRKDMFAALLVATGLPSAKQRYEKLGIPLYVLADTMGDLGIWMRQTLTERGDWGLFNLPWLLNHLTARLFRLGRLQFCLVPFKQPIVVARRRQDGAFAVLSAPEVVYRRDGKVNGTNGIEDSEESWGARYVEDERGIEAHPIGSDGKARRETDAFAFDEWTIALRQGDWSLEVHIPADGRMTPDLCLESMHRADAFYRTHFPEQPFKVFECASWLLDPQFQQILPESSNIVQFQRFFHLFPLKSDESETYYRVFGTRSLDPDAAPRDTGLRRAIADHAQAGNLLHAAGGVLMREDLSEGFKSVN